MFTLIVRSKRDADAVKASLSKFYTEWNIDVRTLHGARRPEEMLETIMDVASSPRFVLVMLGREDKEAAAEVERNAPPNVFVHVVPRARVRNARIEMIANELAKLKAMPRLLVTWDSKEGAYLLKRGGRSLQDHWFDPAFDVFFGSQGLRNILRRAGVEVGENPLVVRRRGGVHYVYQGSTVCAEFVIEDAGFSPKVKKADSCTQHVSVDLSKLLESNRDVLELYERISVNFLRSLGDFDTVIVPWSGGKDSTAALLLAIEAFGKDKVVAVYGDTGTEFPHTGEYVERVVEKLGVELVKAYAGVDKVLRSGAAPLPTHDNRWCTGMKIDAIESTISKLGSGRTLVVVGDRDAESPRRSMRPPLRKTRRGSFTIAAPIKMWGAAHVQLYIMSKGLPLNPLYEYGFYRIGCYMCPSLRSWELYIMTTTPEIHYRLLKSKIYRSFISTRLRRSHAKPATVPASCAAFSEDYDLPVCGG
ncbi:MAG: phosphoadenosine phosphosulfate reductase family protein [Thermoproteota archaeon]